MGEIVGGEMLRQWKNGEIGKMPDSDIKFEI